MCNKKMKQMLAVMLTGAMLCGGAVSAFAEEAGTEAAVTEQSEDASGDETVTGGSAKEIAEEMVRQDYSNGWWIAVYEEVDGKGSTYTGDEILTMPDGSLYYHDYYGDETGYQNIKLINYTMNGDEVSAEWDMTEAPEWMTEEESQGLDELRASTVSLDFAMVQEGDIEKFQVSEQNRDAYYCESGKDQMLILTISAVDNSDPFAPKTVETVLYFLRGTGYMGDYAEYLMRGKTWDLNGQTLTIGGLAEDSSSRYEISLNDGERTGGIVIGGSVTFYWEDDSGSETAFDYVYAGTSGSSVILINKDDPSVQLTLTEIGTESAAAEAE